MQAANWISDFAPWASAAIAAISAALSYLFYWKNSTLNQNLSDRSVRMEAQKMLLEFNKQLIADPALWAIYDTERDGFESRLKEKEFQLKLRAMGNLLINMFDLTLSQVPAGPERTAWLSYFRNVVSRSTTLEMILKEHDELDVYSPEFLAEWKALKGSIKRT